MRPVQRWSIGLISVLALLLGTLLGSAAAGPTGEQPFYVGTYTGTGSDGIYAYRFDPATGDIHPLGLAAATENPSFLATDPDGRFLYAVNELDVFRGEPTGAVSVFAIDPVSGELQPLQQISSLGAGPAHLSLDRGARFLFVANYNGGSIAVFPIGADGRLGPQTAFVRNSGSSRDPERQAAPHTHFIQVTPDNRFTITADLGIDQLLVHRFDAGTGSLTPAAVPFFKLDPGDGPRHVAFAPSGREAYVVNELASTVTAIAFEPGSGEMQRRQTMASLPASFAGRNTAAEIAVDARGRFLYVSNRGHDSIAVFEIDAETGMLQALAWSSSLGKGPRHFAIDPTGQWMVVANQTSDHISLLRRDVENGLLEPTERTERLVAPVCVHFVAVRPEHRGSAGGKGNREQ